MHWTLPVVGVCVAAVLLLQWETVRRLRALARRLDGVDLEVQTLRVRVRALGDVPASAPGTPAAEPAVAPDR